MPTIYKIRRDTVVIDNGYPRGKLALTRNKEYIEVQVMKNGVTHEVTVRADDLWRAIKRIQVV